MTNYSLPNDFNFDPSNPDTRCACVLVLDTSGSMGGEPISQLNAGLQQFLQELQSDPMALSRVELAIVTFGEVVEVIQSFAPVTEVNIPTLSVSGYTPLG
ncbi:MAG: vWA domain-containing protein, partial [Bacteroidota bacterium]